MLGLRKFHKSAQSEDSEEPQTPISIESESEIGEQRSQKLQRKAQESPYNRLNRRVRPDSEDFDDDFDEDEDDPTDDESESADSDNDGERVMSAGSCSDSMDTVESSLKLKRHKDANAGVPCPNHVFLPNGINEGQTTWSDILSAEILDIE